MLNWIGISAINMAIAVALGAFGAHGLKNIASAQQLEWWHTATLYLFIHALGLLLVGLFIRMKYATKSLHGYYKLALSYLLVAYMR